MTAELALVLASFTDKFVFEGIVDDIDGIQGMAARAIRLATDRGLPTATWTGYSTIDWTARRDDAPEQWHTLTGTLQSDSPRETADDLIEDGGLNVLSHDDQEDGSVLVTAELLDITHAPAIWLELHITKG